MHKRILRVLIVISILLFISSCSSNEISPSGFPDEFSKENTIKNTSKGEEHLYNKTEHTNILLKDSVIIDAAVNILPSSQFDVLITEKKPFNIEQIKQLFYSDQNTTMNQTNSNRIEIIGGENSISSIVFNSFNYSQNIDHFFLNGYLRMNSSLISEHNQGRNYTRLSESEKSHSTEAEEAMRLVMEKLKDITYIGTDFENAKMLFVDKQLIEKIFAEADKSYEQSWKYLYCLDMEFSYNDISVFAGKDALSFKGIPTSLDSGYAITTPKVYAIVSNEGIEYLEIRDNFSISSVLESHPIISLNKAIESLQEKFSQLIIDEEIHITNIYLKYLKMPLSFKKEELDQCILKPVWIFEGKKPYYMNKIYVDDLTGELKKSDEIILDYKEYWIYIDAFSGEEII